MELSSSCGAFLSNQGISRHGRYFRGRPHPRRAVRDGSGIDRGCPSCETKMVQSSRHLPDDGAAVELLMIGLVMWPTFRQQVKPILPKVLHKWYFAAPTIHAVLGMTAELLGLYIVVVAGTNILPTNLRFRHWKRWMRTELVLWVIVLVSGVGTYYAWYIAPFR